VLVNSLVSTDYLNRWCHCLKLSYSICCWLTGVDIYFTVLKCLCSSCSITDNLKDNAL
jgi:hypothetical protein